MPKVILNPVIPNTILLEQCDYCDQVTYIKSPGNVLYVASKCLTDGRFFKVRLDTGTVYNSRSSTDYHEFIRNHILEGYEAYVTSDMDRCQYLKQLLKAGILE